MTRWSVLVLLVFIAEQTTFAAARRREGGFVTVEGLHFLLDGVPFYANGFNAYWLMIVASDPAQRHRVSTAFQEAKAHGLNVSRTWAFSDGGYLALQTSPGSYIEKTFQGLDFVVQEAGKHGIKLILSLVNDYNDFGGKNQYVKWGRNLGGQNLSSDDDFFTDSVVKGYYKNHIKAVVTRQNSFTGMAYRDDPTIMAWELMNEPRCPADPSGITLQAWISEMASYLKSIDSNHLLEAGLEGFYGHWDNKQWLLNMNYFQVGADFLRNNQIPGVDFATVHSYPDQWLGSESNENQLSFLKKWITTHIGDSRRILRKPLLFAEFGKSSKDKGYTIQERDELFRTVYSAIYSSARGGVVGGGLFWQLLGQGMDNLRDGYEIVLSESPSTAKLIAEYSRKFDEIPSLNREALVQQESCSVRRRCLLLGLFFLVLVGL